MPVADNLHFRPVIPAEDSVDLGILNHSSGYGYRAIAILIHRVPSGLPVTGVVGASREPIHKTR